MSLPYYLKIGKAPDLKDPKERMIFRFFEILPGSLSWLTLILIVLFSWLQPVLTAVFAIAFAIYWLLRAVYFSFHLASSYGRMKSAERTDWLKKIEELPATNWRQIYHLIIIPTYKEPLEVLLDSFGCLLKSDYPKDRMIVVLSCDESAGESSVEKARAVEREFKNKFFKLLITFHPANLPGELSGKGANESWGASKAKNFIIDPLKISYKNIIVSSFDADTCVGPKYFSCLTYHYLTTKDPWYCGFQPVPLFLNNVWQAQSISKIFAFSATFWQMTCQERPEKLLTFSSHSMGFQALVDVGFRQTNVVSDDSRIFWQCFLRYNGGYKVIPLYYPISMDANVAPSFFQTLKNIYKQQRRWAYGAQDTPYFLFGFIKNKKISLAKKISPAIWIIESNWSWATNSIIIFCLGWLPLVLGGEFFAQTVISYNLSQLTSYTLTLAMIGLVCSAYFSVLLLPKKPIFVSKKKYLFFVMGWFMFPIIMIFFTAVPAIDAQTRLMLGKYMGFWSTPKTRKI